MPKEIRYSHVYAKMMAWNRKEPFLSGKLVFVHKTRFELLDPAFVQYDTLYFEDGKEQHYPLPKKGACLVLFFFVEEGKMIITTIRTDIMQKAAYYEGCLGSMFEFKIIQEEIKAVKKGKKKALESAEALPTPMSNDAPKKPQVFRTTCFNNHTTKSSTIDLHNWACPKCGAQWKQTNLIKMPGEDPAYTGKSKAKYQSCVEETAQHGLCKHGNKAQSGEDCKPIVPSICSHCLRCTTLEFCGVCGKSVCQSCADNGIQCR